MAEKLNPQEIVSFEELLMSNIYTQEALVNLIVGNHFKPGASMALI